MLLKVTGIRLNIHKVVVRLLVQRKEIRVKYTLSTLHLAKNIPCSSWRASVVSNTR